MLINEIHEDPIDRSTPDHLGDIRIVPVLPEFNHSGDVNSITAKAWDVTHEVIEAVSGTIPRGHNIMWAIGIAMMIAGMTISEGTGHDTVEKTTPPVEGVTQQSVVGFLELPRGAVALLVAERVDIGEVHEVRPNTKHVVNICSPQREAVHNSPIKIQEKKSRNDNSIK